MKKIIQALLVLSVLAMVGCSSTPPDLNPEPMPDPVPEPIVNTTIEPADNESVYIDIEDVISNETIVNGTTTEGTKPFNLSAFKESKNITG